ncbi:SDR family oxidoreductase [bacterium]|nr:SDR family oxidoreductase [bacterium]
MRSALVTGTSSGIGEAIALDLAAAGWRVWAGVRDPRDGERLRQAAGGNLEPLALDITDEGQVAAAAERVGGRLDALVNNAGIVVAGPLEALPLAALRRQLEVNVVAQVGVTQALLPALREARGRIVFISSVSGLLAFPLLGAYAASKHALEAVGDAWRRELAPWGIGVSLVEPGPVKSGIWEQTRASAQAAVAEVDEATLALYEGAIAGLEKGAAEAEEGAEEPRVVVDAVRHALTSPNPRTRYLVGPRAKWRTLLARYLPDRWLDRRLAGRP